MACRYWKREMPRRSARPWSRSSICSLGGAGMIPEVLRWHGEIEQKRHRLAQLPVRRIAFAERLSRETVDTRAARHVEPPLQEGYPTKLVGDIFAGASRRGKAGRCTNLKRVGVTRVTTLFADRSTADQHLPFVHASLAQIPVAKHLEHRIDRGPPLLVRTGGDCLSFA